MYLKRYLTFIRTVPQSAPQKRQALKCEVGSPPLNLITMCTTSMNPIPQVHIIHLKKKKKKLFCF